MPKIKSITYLGEEDTYDLEVEHPDHQYFLSNGILTSNSHSVAYSFISVYTAWLRKHYPTEFMCSLLNSEDPNSDKIQEYINECKNMKIQILPPAVSKSGANYVVEEGNIIFTGLSAIKGIGDTAVMNILENKPYNSLVSFLAKTEARVVNKKVVESFAKAGAFDCFGVTRKDIFENHAKYRTKISNKIKKLKEEWAKFNDPETFDVSEHLEEIEKINIEFSPEEWDRKDILLHEKEILGRTISGGLHEIYGNFFKIDSPIVMKLNELDKKKAGTKVKIEVIINNKLKEFTIKNGVRVGSKFAKYSVEDAYGNTSELTVWSDDYEKLKDHLKDGTPIKAICQVNEYMGQKGLSLSSLERRM